MNKQIIGIIALITFATLIPAITSVALETDYQGYKRTSSYTKLFRIVYHEKDISIQIDGPDGTVTQRFPRSDLKFSKGTVSINGATLFDRKGLVLEGIRRNYDEIVDATIQDDGDFFSITFLGSTSSTRRIERIRQGNRISFDQTLVVEEDEFVRGLLLSVVGNIEIYGEVNKDVIGLFGDVYIGPAGVARGDVTSLTGEVDVARDAAVYGEIYTHNKKRVKERHRFRRRVDRFDLTGRLRYNRVDGLLLGLGGKFEDPDSLLPSVWVEGAYAFASERWRYAFGIEQTLMRNPGLAVGGEFYRRLVSEDDRIIGDRENTAFALLVGEDYKDYYEAEGGWMYTRFRPVDNLKLQLGFVYEETSFLPAHHNLWHLFGSKKFDDNYATVDDSLRDLLSSELDSTKNGFLIFESEYDTGDPEERFEHSAVKLSASLEYAHPDFSSSFSYRRYLLTATRFQKVHRRSMLIFSGTFGGSDGYLPLYKRFFLGGLGTLRGYRHKEYMGSRFWMVNTEYRTRFPGSEISASLIYDVGQISNSTFDSDVDIKHSLGFAITLGDDFRISLAKRLDRSDDNAPRLYVRLSSLY